MPKRSANLGQVFMALSDPTRRGVVELLGCRGATTSELARPFKMALPSFVQHMRVLEECGLVRSVKQGRVRRFELVAEPLDHAQNWISEQRALWQRRLDQFDAYVKVLNDPEET
jgi:DNA-binding transcriptional ArsR family regulator